jgi:predicted Zn-dependent protease
MTHPGTNLRLILVLAPLLLGGWLVHSPAQAQSQPSPAKSKNQVLFEDTFDRDEVGERYDDKTRNAFALPGGKIAVYTGIFPVAKNEAGFAAIMGHEVVHALARHGGERISQGLAAEGGLLATQTVMASQGASSQTIELVSLAGGALAQYGIILPYGRQHESEADYIGLLLAADAGYDLTEAVRVWQRMEQFSKGQPPEFLSTHPSHGTRIKQLQARMPEALIHHQNAQPVRAAELPRISGRR